jgi:hypothetical protein
MTPPIPSPGLNRLKPLFQPRAAFRLNLFYRPGVGCGHDHVRRDVRDDGEAANLWRVRDCLIPVIVPLTFRNKHDAPTAKCNKESEVGACSLFLHEQRQ